MSLRLAPTFRDRLADASTPLAGMWVCSGSPVVAEICAGSGIDCVLIDMEHSPNTLDSLLRQLQAVAVYPPVVVVRVPANDTVTIKTVLDTGAQSLLVPMVSSAAEAREAVAAVRYPPGGLRGVGSALARSARWNRVEDYLARANDYVSLTVQIETSAGVAAASEIAAVDGVDAILVGPADLAASMGFLGQQGHPDVVDAVHRVIQAVHGAGKAAGVNAFDPAAAKRYRDGGADFVLVGADVTLLARGSERLATLFAD